VLEQSPGDWQAAAREQQSIRYPGPKARQLTTEDTRLGVFDFLSLGDCDLMQLVSERNSSLGKVMSVTARYHYEWLLLNGVEVCLSQLDEVPEDEDSLAYKLDKIREIKRRELAVYHWNATWGSEIFQTFFSLSQPPLDPEEVSGIQPEVTQSLFDYFKALPHPHEVGSRPVQGNESFFSQSQAAEGYLQPLQYHYGGRVIRSLTTASAAITSGTLMLEQAMEDRPVCINETPSMRSEILQNVFTKFYVMQLQPYLSRLDKEAGLLLTATHRHSPHGFDQSSPAVLAFHDQYLDPDGNNALQSMRKALKQHALTWNRLLRSCGMKVGGTR
jgi:hypothetical protein